MILELSKRYREQGFYPTCLTACIDQCNYVGWAYCHYTGTEPSTKNYHLLWKNLFFYWYSHLIVCEVNRFFSIKCKVIFLSVICLIILTTLESSFQYSLISKPLNTSYVTTMSSHWLYWRNLFRDGLTGENSAATYSGGTMSFESTLTNRTSINSLKEFCCSQCH